MMSVNHFSPEQQAWAALVENVVSRTGCAPVAIVNLLFEGNVTPDDKDLLDTDTWAQIALDVVVEADGSGLPANHCAASRSTEDQSWIALARGVRLGEQGSETDMMVARIAVCVGEGASAVRHALRTTILREGWSQTAEGQEEAERLVSARFVSGTDTHH